MFAIARSVFWLTLAYVVIKPGTELPDAATLSAHAANAGAQAVMSQLQNIECNTLHCVGGKAVITAAMQTTPSAAQPMHEPAAANPVPIPRPRPD